MAKAKILEEIGECWNDVNVDPNGASSIQPNDKVTLYKLSTQEKSRGEISNSSWNTDVNDCSNIIILRRDKSNDTKIMCRNENLRDATDDVCEMISEWYTRLLYQYNISLYESDQVDTIKKLMDRSTDQDVHDRIEGASDFLGGVTFNELIAIGGYKRRRNAKVHKVKWSTQDVALKRLDIASAQMTPECRNAIEKCIKVIYRS